MYFPGSLSKAEFTSILRKWYFCSTLAANPSPANNYKIGDDFGINISGFKGVALHLGLDSAVYLDGSDSVMLMLDNDIVISQASNKNETNVTGIGFTY